MALTGKLLADFSSFQSAVQKADTELKSMEASAGKVGGALNRMVDNFSGRKLIQDATLAAEAIERIGGTSRLTETELARVQAQATEAAAKLKAMGQEVPPGIQKIADAAKNIEPPLTMADKAAGLLKSTFGQFTAANIVSNLIGKAADEIGRFVEQGSKFPGLQNSFNNLTRGIGQDGAAMLNNMSTATKGLVSNYDLVTSANKAMLLGLPVTSESMGDLAKAATTLGKAMGQDATTSLNDLITALGRSSPMILDNLGLTVKVGEANDAYAAKLGKSAEQLTDAEKKLAFYEAAMEAARTKTKELGDQTQTLGEIASAAWIKVGNAVTEAAGVMNVGIGRAISSGENFLQFMKDMAAFSLRGGSPIAAAIAAQNARASAASSAPSSEQAWWDEQVRKDAEEQAAALAKLAESKKKLAEEQKKQAEASKKAAEALRSYASELSGAKLQGEVDRLTKAVALLSAEERKRPDVIKRIVSESEALRSQGARLTPELSLLAITSGHVSTEMQRLAPSLDDVTRMGERFDPKPIAQGFIDMSAAAIKAQKEIHGVFGLQNANLGQVQELPKIVKATKVDFDDLSRSLSQMATIAGGSFGAVVQGLASIVGALDTAQKGLESYNKGMEAFKDGKALAGIAGMASGILGIASAAIAAGKAIANAFDRDKGRDLVEDFAKSFGGFDALHKALETLGAAGEELWIKLTQGVGRNNPEQAARVIAEVEEALARQKKAQDDAIISTEEGARATIETATEAQKALDELSGRLLVNADEWGAWSDAVMLHIQKLAEGIRSLPPLPPNYTGGAVLTQPRAILTGRSPSGPYDPGVAAGSGRALAPAQINLNGRALWEGMIEVAAAEGLT